MGEGEGEDFSLATAFFYCLSLATTVGQFFIKYKINIFLFLSLDGVLVKKALLPSSNLNELATSKPPDNVFAPSILGIIYLLN